MSSVPGKLCSERDHRVFTDVSICLPQVSSFNARFTEGGGNPLVADFSLTPPKQKERLAT